MCATLRRLGLALLLMVPAWVQAGEPAPLELQGGWIRSAPPAARVQAGYGTLHNVGTAPLAVERLSAPAFEEVEIHEMSMADGVMRMRPHTLVLAPGATATLAPGGVHLMLMRPRAPLKTGQRVAVEFHFSGGATRTLEFEVRDAAPARQAR
jgi:copper(I)-binding protein